MHTVLQTISLLGTCSLSDEELAIVFGEYLQKVCNLIAVFNNYEGTIVYKQKILSFFDKFSHRKNGEFKGRFYIL